MGSNDSKNKFLKFFQDGKFPRFTRIGLDVGWNILLFFIVIGLVGGFAIGGVGLGYFASLVDDMPVEDEEEMKQLVLTTRKLLIRTLRMMCIWVSFVVIFIEKKLR